MDDQRTDRASGGMKTLLAAFLVLITVVAHVIIGVVVYRHVHAPELVVFFVPMVAAIGLNTLIIGTAMPAKWKAVGKYAAACALALLVGIFAEIVSLTFAFNMYGT